MKNACVIEMQLVTINTKAILATFQCDLFQNVMKAVTSLKLAMRMEMMELKVLETMIVISNENGNDGDIIESVGSNDDSDSGDGANDLNA